MITLSGCGSSGSTAASSTPSSAPASTLSAVAPTLPPDGKYVASMTSDGLRAAGVDTGNVGAGGVWHMSISPSKLKLDAPEADDHTIYGVVAITKHRLTLAGNPLCSVVSAQTKKSVYTISTSPQGLRFTGVKVACKEDGGAITAGYWTNP